MNQKVRDTILSRIQAAPATKVPIRPKMPELHDLSMTRSEQIEKFTQNLMEQTGIVHRVKNKNDLLEKLEPLLKEESIRTLIATEDEMITSLNLKSWGEKRKIMIRSTSDFKDRGSYKQCVFSEADAGITGVDFAVSESGTLVIAHDRNNARLVSLAPILHIAVVPIDKLVPVYEKAVEHIFANGLKPSQVTFITGPSMTADIQATPFKGMHGPKRVVVFLVGD